jgi:hypothetical protein
MFKPGDKVMVTTSCGNYVGEFVGSEISPCGVVVRLTKASIIEMEHTPRKVSRLGLVGLLSFEVARDYPAVFVKVPTDVQLFMNAMFMWPHELPNHLG